MRSWMPFELHTHTHHSDGRHSLAELAQSAQSLGLKGFALTDHNTMAGFSEQDEVEAATNQVIIRGVEWTTFFGHMVVLGIGEYIDWRNFSPFHLDKAIQQVHDQGGVVGVAHPYRPGSPICAGCFWEFPSFDWHCIDYIEVWSGLFPSINPTNKRAFAKWTSLLNEGYRITATCGRDWHNSRPIDKPVAVTYLGVPENDCGEIAQGTLTALQQGAVSITMGPLLLLTVHHRLSGRVWGIGEVVGELTDKYVDVCIDLHTNDGFKELPEQPWQIRIHSNKGNLIEFTFPIGEHKAIYSVGVSDLAWIRAEMYGTLHEMQTMIAFTNPIYFI